MAEGHAVARWADALRGLVHERVDDVRAPRRWQSRADQLVGETIADVRTHGKHLVIEFSASLVIHTHAMQYGSWQIGERDLTPRKAPRFIRLTLITEAHQAVFFHGPVMEILTLDEFAAHDRFHGLGPDLLHEGFDVDVAVARLQGAMAEIGLAVVDQRNVAGIGNIYKSEGLFLANIHPQTPAAAVSVELLHRFFAELIPLMQRGRRHYGATITLPEAMRTADSARNWVYRRRGKPCFLCDTPIAMIRQGELRRMTFFCPSCQSRAKERSATILDRH